MNKKAIQVWYTLFGKPMKVHVLFAHDPNNDELDIHWEFIGIYARKKDALERKRQHHRDFYWSDDCYMIKEEEVHL